MEIVIRAVVIYLFLLGVTRALGKTALGELNVFELLTAIIIAELVGPAIMQEDQSLVGAMLAVATFVALTVALAWVQARFPRAGRLVEGQPVVVVLRGEVQRDAMKLERLALTDLLQAAREQGIRDLSKVDMAVLEVDGAISFFVAER